MTSHAKSKMASLTPWERTQLENVHFLLEQARTAILDLTEKEKALKSVKGMDTSKDWLTFRSITFDLYSVLDYTFFLLYCHFSNKGKPDFSRKANHLGFPSKPTGVKTSEKDAHDQSRKFMREKLESLWGKTKIGEMTHFWKKIGEIVVEVQPKLKVDQSGAVLGDPTISKGDEESFALLHFYRNCSAHKDLIRFLPEKSWVEINQSTRETKLVKERQEQKGYFYYELDKGYWVDLPEAIAGPEDNENDSRLLLDVLHQMMNFVTKTASKLLCYSLLLPSARVLLRKHFAGCTIETKFIRGSGMQQAVVTVTTKDGKEAVESSRADCHKLQVDAEEEACSFVMSNLAKKDILPDPPYSFFTPHYVQPYPPVQVLDKTDDKTYRMLMNEYEQRLRKVGLEPKTEYIVNPVKGKEQYYSVCFEFFINDDQGQNLVQIFSDDHEDLGKEKPKEPAVAEVMKECIHLGIIQLK